MSRVARIVLASLVTLAVIVGIYTSVQGAALSSPRETVGAHVVGGALVNLDHYRAAQASVLQTMYQDTGHGCHSDENLANSDD